MIKRIIARLNKRRTDASFVNAKLELLGKITSGLVISYKESDKKLLEFSHNLQKIGRDTIKNEEAISSSDASITDIEENVADLFDKFERADEQIEENKRMIEEVKESFRDAIDQVANMTRIEVERDKKVKELSELLNETRTLFLQTNKHIKE